MPTFQADPSNLADLLTIVQDGCEIGLKSGDYKGPFTIEKAVTIRGTGADTVIFAVDEPALVVKVAGVRIENLAIARTVGGDTGEVVLSADAGTSPILNQVRLRGTAANVQWEGASWDIPAVLDFGEIESNRQVQRSWDLQLEEPCEVISEMNWLYVQPSHLSPGLQTLEVVLNSSDVPAGTLLSGSIFLNACNSSRKIDIAAKIKQASTQNFSLQEEKEIFSQSISERELGGLAAEDWGYRFLGSAVDNWLRDVEGKEALDKYGDFSERRDSLRDSFASRAEAILAEILGKKSRLFYLRRLGQGQQPGEEKWELAIATDIKGVKLPRILAEREKTLSLRAVVSRDGYGGLRLISARLVSKDAGRADGFTLPCCIRLLPERQYRIGVPRAAIARVSAAPVCGDRVPAAEQLPAWTAFVKIERRIAEARQFCVPFVSHNSGASTRQIAFKIDASDATIDGSPETSITEADLWKRVFQARNEEIQLFKPSPDGRSRRYTERLGRIAGVDSERRQIRIWLDSDLVERLNAGNYQLPTTGFLLFEAWGELSQIDRKERALEDLRRERAQNPYLSEFFFDASKARSPQKLVKLQPQDLLLPSANPDQLAAVEAVLSAPDMVLIQGPPGTGKTTVIAEICYQIARRGGRTLIASQANLAVDNALSRLVHNPVIRALRKGKADKVQEEGQPFLEEQVIGTWLQNTADDCENGLAKRRDNIELYRQLLASSERFVKYLKAEEALQSGQKKLQKRKASLQKTCKAQEKARAEAEAQQRPVESLLLELEALLAAPSVDWDNSAIASFLPQLEPYAKGDSSVKSFVSSVKTASDVAADIGFVPPQRRAFGLAAWLRETVAPSLSDCRRALTDAREAAAAFRDFEEAVQVYEKDSASLEQMRTTYQEVLAGKKALQQKIQKGQARKAEIDLVIKEVKFWLESAQARIYEALKRCLQQRKGISESFVQLPPGLVGIAQSVNLPIVPNYGTKPIDALPEWERLTKAVELEAQNGFTDLLGKHSRFSEFLHQSLNPPPVVLSASDRAPWLEIAEQFAIYQRLTQSQRRNLLENTRQLLKQMQPVYGAAWEPTHIEATLNQLAQEVLNDILRNARACVGGVKAETEKRLETLQQQFDEIAASAANLHAQGTAFRDRVELARQEADDKFNRLLHLLQKLYQVPQLPENLRLLTEQCIGTPSDIPTRARQLPALVHSWESQLSQLETLIPALEPLAVLSLIRNKLSDRLSTLQQETEAAQQQLAQSQSELDEIEQQLQPLNLPESLIAERNWWQEAYLAIPDRLKPDAPPTGIFDLDFLTKVKAQFDSWQQELAKEEAYLNRFQSLVGDWSEKLRNPSAQDRSELKQIYLDNANVIGITCMQSARREFSEEFKNFDVVIIDEVSKCTPPEILIPALKAQRLVLVGDHRQLPPMLNDNSIEEIAEEMGSTPDELKFLEESLFKFHFEAAAESIKQMLTIQYRMHPTIMGAINQFYAHRLQCGLPNPDRQRAHNLAGPIIREDQHLIWVKMPLQEEFREQKQGTSPFNVREVDVIERLCQQLEAAWAPKIARGEPRKEIGIITFYLAQLELIENRIDPDRFPSLHVRTGTVDRFQGMERQVIIVSMVRNNREGKVGFAKKPERVNVAFSRAQELLIIIGCHSLFTQHPGPVGSMYSEVSNVVRRQGGLVDVSSILS